MNSTISHADPPACAQVFASRADVVSLKIGATAKELEAAFRLVYQAYVKAGLDAPNDNGMRVTPYQLLPTSDLLMAVHGETVIATATLVGDGELGLPLESLYPEEVARRRGTGSVMAEVSCLADRRRDMARRIPLLTRLMSFIAQTATQRGIDQLLIVVHPRHAKFYERYLGFESIGDVTYYAAVQNHPAVPLALDLASLATQHPVGYRRLYDEPFPEEMLTPPAIPDEVRQHFRRFLMLDNDVDRHDADADVMANAMR